MIHSVFAAQNIISFLSQSRPIKLAAFMNFMDIEKDDWAEYKMFYENIISDMYATRSRGKKNLRLQKIEQQGMNSLEIKHSEWASKLSALPKKNRVLYSNAHTFVARYALLELYYEQKARQKNTMWTKVQGFFGQTKETVAGWFSSLRPKRKTERSVA